MGRDRVFRRAATRLLCACVAMLGAIVPHAVTAQPANQDGFSRQGQDFLVSILFGDAETWHDGEQSLIAWQHYARREPPARIIDAADLAQEYVADPAAAERAYKGQEIGVRGAVVGADKHGRALPAPRFARQAGLGLRR